MISQAAGGAAWRIRSTGAADRAAADGIYWPAMENHPPPNEWHSPAIENRSPLNENDSPPNQNHSASNEIHSRPNENDSPLNEIHSPSNEIRSPSNEIRSPSNENHSALNENHSKWQQKRGVAVCGRLAGPVGKAAEGRRSPRRCRAHGAAETTRRVLDGSSPLKICRENLSVPKSNFSRSKQDYVFDKQWWCCSRCEQQRPLRCGRKRGETLKFRRLTLRSATGLPQRGKLHHPLFVNDIIPGSSGCSLTLFSNPVAAVNPHGTGKSREPAGWKACATRGADILVGGFRGLSSPQ